MSNHEDRDVRTVASLLEQTSREAGLALLSEEVATVQHLQLVACARDGIALVV